MFVALLYELILGWFFIGIQFPGCPNVVVGSTAKTQGWETDFKCADVGCVAGEVVVEIRDGCAAVYDGVWYCDHGIGDVAFDTALVDGNAPPLNFGGDGCGVVFEIM